MSCRIVGVGRPSSRNDELTRRNLNNASQPALRVRAAALDYLSYAPSHPGEAGLRNAHHVSAELFRPSLVPWPQTESN